MRGCFCFELGVVKERTSGRVVSMVDVNDVFWGAPGVATPDQARKATYHVSVHLFWPVNLCLSNVWC